MAVKPSGLSDLPSTRVLSPVYGTAGDHRMHGIFVGRGPMLRRGVRVDGARIIDCAPTILWTFGVTPPADMDGRVLNELFADPSPAPHAPAMSAAVPTGASDQLTEEERQEIRRRLQSYGYLG
jgi:hypothetical protein